jgi:hypothetical protein
MTLLLFFNLFLLSQVIPTPDLLPKWKEYAFKEGEGKSKTKLILGYLQFVI